ncbi:UNVERIFIED_CONTAM: hypothetical protein HHA_233210 [Hammondia hammondi]|eukprot:XP_008882783.1 hypothetical protein HHA_233210 [Hammondia hammondi]
MQSNFLSACLLSGFPSFIQSRPILITASPGVNGGGCVPVLSDFSPDVKNEIFMSALWHAPFASSESSTRCTRPTTFLPCSFPSSGTAPVSRGLAQSRRTTQGRCHEVHAKQVTPHKGKARLHEPPTSKQKEVRRETRDCTLTRGFEEIDGAAKNMLRSGEVIKLKVADPRHGCKNKSSASQHTASLPSWSSLFHQNEGRTLSRSHVEPDLSKEVQGKVFQEKGASCVCRCGAYNGQNGVPVDSHYTALAARHLPVLTCVQATASDGESEREKEKRREQTHSEGVLVESKNPWSGVRLSDRERGWKSEKTPSLCDVASEGKTDVDGESSPERWQTQGNRRTGHPAGKCRDPTEDTESQEAEKRQGNTENPQTLPPSGQTSSTVHMDWSTSEDLPNTVSRETTADEEETAEEKGAHWNGKTVVKEKPEVEEVCCTRKEEKPEGSQNEARGSWDSPVCVEKKNTEPFKDACAGSARPRDAESETRGELQESDNNDRTSNTTAALPQSFSPLLSRKTDKDGHDKSARSPKGASPEENWHLPSAIALPQNALSFETVSPSPSPNTRNRSHSTTLRGCREREGSEEVEQEKEVKHEEEIEQEKGIEQEVQIEREDKLERKEKMEQGEIGEKEGESEDGEKVQESDEGERKRTEKSFASQHVSLLKRSVRRASKLVASGKSQRDGRRLKLKLKSTRSFWSQPPSRRFKHLREYRLPSFSRHLHFLSKVNGKPGKCHRRLFTLLSHPRTVLASSHFSLKPQGASSSNSSLSSALHGGNPGAGDPAATPTRSSSSLPQERADVHSLPTHSGHVLRFLAFGASLHGNAECRESAKTRTKRRNKGETTDTCLSQEAVADPDRHSTRCLSSVYHFAQDNIGFYGTCTSSCSSCCTSTSPWDSQASCLYLNPSRDEAAGSVSLQKRVEAPLQCLSASLTEVHRRGDRSYVSLFENEGCTRESLLEMSAFSDAHNNYYSLDRSRCRPRHQCHGPSLRVSCSESNTHITHAAESAVDPSSGAKDTTRETESSHSKAGDTLDSIFDAEAGSTIQGTKTSLRVESRTFNGKSPKTTEPLESPASAVRRDRNSEKETHEALRERTKSFLSHNQAGTRKKLETNARRSRQHHEEYLRQESGESQEARREVRHPWTGREKGVFSQRAVTTEKEGFCGSDLLFKKYIKQVEKVERQIEREQRLTRRRIEEGDVEQIQQVVTKNTKLVYFLIIVNITVLMLCFFFALFPIHLSNHEKAIRSESSFDAVSEKTEAVRDFGVSPRPLKSLSSSHVSSASPFFPATAAGAQPYPFLSASPLGSKRNPRHRGHSAEAFHPARTGVDFARRDVGNVQGEHRDGRPRLLVEHRFDMSDTGAHMLRSAAAAGPKTAPPENGTSSDDRRESESSFVETNKQATDRAGEEDSRHRVLLVTPLTELYEIPAETFKDLVIVLKMNPSGSGSSHEPAGSTLTKVLSVAGVEEQTEKENPSGSRRKTIFFYTGDTLIVDKKSATLKNAKGEVEYYWDFVVDKQSSTVSDLHGRLKESANVDGLGLLSQARSECPACDKEHTSDEKTGDGNDASQNSRIQSGRDAEAALSPPSVWTGDTTQVMDFEVSSNRQEEREASEKTHTTVKIVDCTEAQETPLEEVMKKAKSVFFQATDRRGERNQSLRRTRFTGAREAYERGRRSFASREKTNDEGGEPGKRADENAGVKDNVNGGKEHTVAAHSSEDNVEKRRGARDGERGRAEENSEGEMKPAVQPRIPEEATLVENDLRESRPSAEIETPPKAPPRRLMANAMLGFANAFDQFARIGGALLSPAISMAQTLDVAGALIANPQAAGLGANALPVYAPPSALTVASTGVPSYGTFASTSAGSVVSGIAANTPPPPRLPQAVGSAGLSVSSFGPATVAVQSQPQIVYTASATPQQTYVYSGGLTGPVYPVSTGTVGTVDSSFLTYPGAYYTNGGYQAITVATPAVNDGSLYVIATGQENQESQGNGIRNLSSGFSDAGAWAAPGSPDLAPDGSAQSGILSTSLGVPLQRRLNDVRTSAEEIRNEGSGDSVLERNNGR